MENLNLKDKSIQETLSIIGISTMLPNGQMKSFNKVMIELSNMFKKLNAENKAHKKEILNKFYLQNEDGTQSQIYCHERDLLENQITNNNILMKYICNKLAGIRKSNKLYLFLTSMRLRKNKNKTK